MNQLFYAEELDSEQFLRRRRRQLDWKEDPGGNVDDKENELGEGEDEYEEEISESESGELSENEMSAWDALQVKRWEMFSMSQAYDDENVETIRRHWVSNFLITGLTNLTEESFNCFLVIRFGHVNKNRRNIRGSLRTRHMYTSVYSVKANQAKVFPQPILIWRDKVIKMSCIDLSSFSVELQVWKVSNFTFNKFLGRREMTLKTVLSQEARCEVELVKEQPPTKGANQRTVRAPPVRVMRLAILLSLAEVYEFVCNLADWSVELWRSVVDYNEHSSYYLQFEVPISENRRTTIWSSSAEKSSTNPRRRRRSVAFSDKAVNHATQYFNNEVVSFRYVGRNDSFASNYIRVSVYEWYPIISWFGAGGRRVGTSIISLRNVHLMPNVTGIVKQLTVNPDDVVVGTVAGRINVLKYSGDQKVKSDGAEDLVASIFSHDVDKDRLEQPRSTGPNPFLFVNSRTKKAHFLVVKVFRGMRLPAKDEATQLSNPSIEVCWDKTAFKSAAVRETLYPVWNETFYFPLRLTDDVELETPALVQHCLPVDLGTKGPVTLTVWHTDDDGNTELMATGSVDLSVLTSRDTYYEFRSLLEVTELAAGDAQDTNAAESRFQRLREEVGDAEAEEVEDVASDAGAVAEEVPFFKVKRRCRVWHNDAYPLKDEHGDISNDATRTKTLTIGGVAGNDSHLSSAIAIEMFFFPPLPDTLTINKPAMTRMDIVYKQIQRRWDRDWEGWYTAYREWYPKATLYRFWNITMCTVHDQLVPLPSLVSPIPCPMGLDTPGDVLHWIGCLSYLSLPLTVWNTPHHTLSLKKGSLQDHAVILCSLLLGMGFDAYVAIGQAKADAETETHVWVVTRDAGRYVTHWDPLLLTCYPTPLRYGITYRIPTNADQYDPEDLGAGIKADGEEEEGKDEEKSMPYFNGQYLSSYWAGAAERYATIEDEAELTQQELMDLLGVESVDSSLLSRKNVLDDTHRPNAGLENLSVAPVVELCSRELAAWLPYRSIEILFNNEQLWGNLQNADPSTIYYDVESPYQWRPLLTSDVRPIPVDTDLSIAPAPPEAQCKKIQESLQADVCELIQLARTNKGLVTHFEDNETLHAQLIKYLELMEYRSHLDPRCDPRGPKPIVKGTEKQPSLLSPGELPAVDEEEYEEDDDGRQFDVGEEFSRDSAEKTSTSVQAKPARARIAKQAERFGLWEPRTGIEGELVIVEEEPENRTSIKQQYRVPVLQPAQVERRNRKFTLARWARDKRAVNGVVRLAEAGNHSMLNPIETYGSEDALSEEDMVKDDSEDEDPDYLAAEYAQSAERGGADAGGETDGDPAFHDRIITEDGDVDRADDEGVREADAEAREGGATGEGPLLEATDYPFLHRYDFSNDEYDENHLLVETQKWGQYYELFDAFGSWKDALAPIREGYALCGVPIHLSGADITSFRAKLLSSARIRPLIDIAEAEGAKEPLFVISTRCFPLIGGLLSCWVFLGLLAAAAPVDSA